MKKMLTLILCASALPAWAVIQPAPVFTDYAVLQQGEPVRIWGTAEPGEEGWVKFNHQERPIKADQAGRWMVTLDPMEASSEGRTLQIGEVKLKDVVIGEVWLAGGQSNMASIMDTYRKKTQPDIDAAKDPLLRMITIPHKHYADHEVAPGKWNSSTPETVPYFSASAYYFAKHLREKLGVPVGIISCSVGGTPAEAWMSREALAGDEDLKRIVEAYEHYVDATIKDETEYIARHEAYTKELEIVIRKRAAGDMVPWPQSAMGPRDTKRPHGLYDYMLTETIPYTIKGFIWYQGESNVGTGAHYRKVFSALIDQWRSDFKDEDLPFLFVQLATFGHNGKAYWAELRESQRLVNEEVPNTGMIVLLDGGEQDDIHPHAKDLVGDRLALLARNMVYGEKELVCNGPTLTRATVKGSTIELTFDDTGSGLVLKPGGAFTFELCGEDGVFKPAEAELKDGKIVLSAEAVPEPKYARYAWHQWVEPTLYNKEGLPASPFRTDDFPMETEGRYYLDWLK